MSKENNKMQVDIENLFKQNVNDLSAIKELYRKLKEAENKILQIKYIDTNLANKLKKDYESLKKDYENLKRKILKDYEELKCVILDENIQAKLTDDIKTINSQLDTKANKIDLPSPISKTLAKLETSDEDVVILVAGDSIVHGRKLSVQDNETYTYKLAELIASKYKYTNVIAVCGNTIDNSENRKIDTWDEYVIQTSPRKQKVYVVRSGVGGDTLLRLYRRINDIIQYKGLSPDLIILHEGINDSLSNDGSKYVSTDRYFSGYCSMIQYLKNATNAEIVLCTSHWFGSKGGGNAYVSMQKRAGKTEKCKVIDLWDIWQNHYNANDGTSSGQGTWLKDGSSDKIHCTPTGYLEGIAVPIFNELFNKNQKIVENNHKLNNIIRYDNPRINYFGVWDDHNIKDNYDNVLFSTKISDKNKETTGNYLTVKVKGKNVYLLARRGIGLGSANIYVNNILVQTIDFSTEFPRDTSDVNDIAICSYFYERIKIINNSTNKENIIKIEQIENGFIPFYGIETDCTSNDEKIMNSGTITITGDGNTYMSAKIYFIKEHNTPPVVVANANNKDFIVAIQKLENTSYTTIYIGRRDNVAFTSSVNVNWISIDS